MINFESSISDSVGVQYSVPFVKLIAETDLRISFRLCPKSSAP